MEENNVFGTLLKMDETWYYLIDGDVVYEKDERGYYHRATKASPFYERMSKQGGFYDWLWSHYRNGNDCFVDSYVSRETAGQIFERRRKKDENEKLVVIDVRNF